MAVGKSAKNRCFCFFLAERGQYDDRRSESKNKRPSHEGRGIQENRAAHRIVRKHREVLSRQETDALIKPDAACECCGKSVEQIFGRKKRRFCFDACRQKWWNSHMHLVQWKAVYMLTCHHCGIVFEIYGNSRRKYCSHACYIAEWFGRCKSARIEPFLPVRGDRL